MLPAVERSAKDEVRTAAPTNRPGRSPAGGAAGTQEAANGAAVSNVLFKLQVTSMTLWVNRKMSGN